MVETRRWLRLAVLALALLLLAPALAPLAPAQQPPVATWYSTDFEGGVAGWSHKGAHDEWELGEPTTGPGFCHSGTHCWVTDLDGEYDNDTNAWLTSPLIDLRTAESPVVSFFAYWDFFYLFLIYDEASLQVSTDNGSTWDVAWSQIDHVWGGQWQQQQVGLAPWRGNTVLLGFHVVDDVSDLDFANGDGLYLDDLVVAEGPQPGPITSCDPGVTVDASLRYEGQKPDPVAPGGQVKFVMEATNVGLTPLPQGTVDLTIGAANGAWQLSIEVPPLDVGDGIELGALWDVPKGIEGPVSLVGTYVPDADDCNPADNDIAAEVHLLDPGIPPPPPPPPKLDGAVSDLSVDPLSGPVGVRTVIAIVDNLGQVALEPSSTTLKFSVIDSGGVTIASDSAALSVPPGEQRKTPFKVNIADEGVYSARAELVVPGDQVPANNVRTVSFTVGDVPAPDLSVVSLSADPALGAVGALLSLTPTITNLGAGPADGVVSMRIVDTAGVDVFAERQPVVLPAGQSTTTTFQWTPSAGGTYTATARTNVAGDLQPDNDARSLVIPVLAQARDGRVDAISVSPRTAGLVERSLRATVSNHGDVAEDAKVLLVVSGVSTFSTTVPVSLPIGGSVDVETPFTPTTYGTLTLAATLVLPVDDDHPEDNVATVDFFVTDSAVHDLVVASVMGTPRTAAPGIIRELVVSVVNAGTVDEVTDLTILVTPPTGSGAPPLSIPVQGLQVPAAATVTITKSVTPDELGTYDVLASATVLLDADTSNDLAGTTIFVSNDTNNLMAQNLTVTPPVGVPNQQRSLHGTVVNAGVGPASGVSIELSISGTVVRQQLVNLDAGESVDIDQDFTPTSAGVLIAMLSATWTDPIQGDNTVLAAIHTVDYSTVDGSLESLAVLPAVSGAGSLRTATLELRNVGTGDADGSVLWTLSGPEQSTQSLAVTLQGGASPTLVTLELSPSAVGTYLLEAELDLAGDSFDDNDRLAATLVVLPPPSGDLAVLAVWVDRTDPMVGEPLTPSVMVANVGDATALGTLLVRIEEQSGGPAIYAQQLNVSVLAGTTQTFTLPPWAPSVAGAYTLVGELASHSGNPADDRASARLSVRPNPGGPPPPPIRGLDVALGLTISPQEPRVDRPLTITVSLTNHANQSVSAPLEVTVTVDDPTGGTQALTLRTDGAALLPGGTTQASGVVTLQSEGTHIVRASLVRGDTTPGDNSATLEVEVQGAPWWVTEHPAGVSTIDSSSAILPLTLLLLVVAAIVALSVVLAHRSRADPQAPSGRQPQGPSRH